MLDAGGFDTTRVGVTEDWQLSMHIAALGPILYLPETLASYRRHDENISTIFSEKVSQGTVHGLESMAEVVEKRAESKLTDIYKRELYRAYISAGWSHRQIGNKRATIRNYIRALRLKPWNLGLALRIVMLSILPTRLIGSD